MPDHQRKEREPPRNPVNRVFSAIPVTMPGSAIGRTTSSDTASRPKKS
jgi:hypothetical protein